MASSGETNSSSLTDQQLPRLQKQLWEKNLQFRTFIIIYRFFPAHGEEIASIPFLGNTLPRGTELLQHSMGTSRAGGRIQGGFLSGGCRGQRLCGQRRLSRGGRIPRGEGQWDDRCSSVLPVQLEGFRSDTPSMQSDPGTWNTDGGRKGNVPGDQ